jgi:hypothetical protein
MIYLFFQVFSTKMSRTSITNVVQAYDSAPKLELSVEETSTSNVIPKTTSQNLQISGVHSLQMEPANQILYSLPSTRAILQPHLPLSTTSVITSRPTPSMKTTKRQYSLLTPSVLTKQINTKQFRTLPTTSASELQSQAGNSNTGNMPDSHESDVFFPLTVSPEKDSKLGIVDDTSAAGVTDMSTGIASTNAAPVACTENETTVLGQELGPMPGSYSSGSSSESDMDQPAPISGPISCAEMAAKIIQAAANGMVPVSISLKTCCGG